MYKHVYDPALIAASIEARRLGDTGNNFPHEVEHYEWPSNHLIGEEIMKNAAPKTRQEALEVVRGWLREGNGGKPHPWAAMESYTRWQHYTAEMGYDYIGCELGANVSVYNLSVAFTRGAAKQYDKSRGLGNVSAWFVDYSLWNWLGMVNYSGDPDFFSHARRRKSLTPVSGQGINQCRRGYYLIYMSGAQWLINEGGGESSFYPELEADGYYKLSPHGEVNRDFYDFVCRHPDRGETIVPIALVLNHDHGLPYGHWKEEHLVFEALPQTAGDRMINDLFQTVYSTAYSTWPMESVGQQITAPYGDVFDVLTHEADPAVLADYPALILAGDIAFSDQDKQKYMEYVANGGTLLLHAMYAEAFPAFPEGKGRVIRYDKVEELKDILPALLCDLLPVTVDGDVETIVNRNDRGIVVTLINNNGVVKPWDSDAVFDSAGTRTVTVTYTGEGDVTAASEWVSDTALPATKVQTVEIAPGDVKIIEFVVK
ncbi:MAG: hypothetical protein IJ518_04305 [Clostridia bacterium]|nr:hypothetical protein [Clostridia bacterium]